MIKIILFYAQKFLYYNYYNHKLLTLLFKIFNNRIIYISLQEFNNKIKNEKL